MYLEKDLEINVDLYYEFSVYKMKIYYMKINDKWMVFGAFFPNIQFLL